jgi:hypothetical protein
MQEWQFHHAVLCEEGSRFVAVGDDGEEVEQQCRDVPAVGICEEI